MKPRLLDLFAGAGGCSVGYARAGFDVEGVDIEAHADYPFELHVADAMDVLAGDVLDLSVFDVIHASPPCPRYSTATHAEAKLRHPDLIPPCRERLRDVPGAPLRSPTLLCGSAFGLPVRRHRLFESNVLLLGAPCQHPDAPAVGVYGDHPDRPGGWLRPDGTSRGVKATSIAEAQTALGIDWMTTWDDLTDAIPPSFTEHLGVQLLAHLAVAA